MISAWSPARQDRALTLAQPLEIRDILALAQRVLPPPGYWAGYMQGTPGKGAFTVGVTSSQGTGFRAEETGAHLYVVLSALLKQCKADVQVTKAARAMCIALGLKPDALGPYPLGPLPIGVAAMGYGGAYVGPAAAETRRNVEWLRPHAAMMQVAMREFAATERV